MKITAGLGAVEDYVRYVKAGADDFFCGYVPYEWIQKYGSVLPLNRREVLGIHVQIGSESELELLAALVKKYRHPVHLTLNALYYIPEQYPQIAELIQKCKKMGFQSFIVADPALLLYLQKQQISCEIHLSGETAEVNRQMLSVFEEFGIRRLIFHRKNSLAEMQDLIQYEKSVKKTGPTEFEAFALNEQCQFSGAFCNSLHCDEMGYLCRLPYRLAVLQPEKQWKPESGDSRQPEKEANAEDGYLCGESGCGMCALYRMKEAGITHLKLVGRGNYAAYMERDIRNLRRALDILEESKSEEDYQKRMKEAIFPHGCSGNCYYHKEKNRPSEKNRRVSFF